MDSKMVIFNVSEDDHASICDGKKWFLDVDRPESKIDVNDIAVIRSNLVGNASKLITCIDTTGMAKGYVVIGF